MRPRFVGRLGLADAISAANAGIGFLAVAVLPHDPGVAARLILLAAIADGLDGIVARLRGGTPVGEHLDSLADVASFGIAPAALVAAVTADGIPLSSVPFVEGGTVASGTPVHVGLALGVPAVYATLAVVRLAFYTAYDVENDHTLGMPTTLAGTILAASVLAGAPIWSLVASIALFTYLMVARVRYPDLRLRDALLMGAVQAGAVLVPSFYGALFPTALLAWATAFLVFGPSLYWR